MSDKNQRGPWYWLVALNPFNWILARLFGGEEAAREGEAAVRDVAPLWGIAAAIAVIVLVAFAIVIVSGVR